MQKRATKKPAKAAEPLPWTLTQKARNIFRVECPWEQNTQWEKWFFLCSDQHWDNPHCDRDLYKRHLDQAVERNAGIIMVGDLFCLMQGKFDPRHIKTDVRPEHDVDDYIDAVIEDCADFHAPYADRILVVGAGNHEYHILKRLETNPTERFCQSIYNRTGHKIYNGLYAGWIQFMFRYKDKKLSQSLDMKYHHGYGGGGIVTKGAIQNQRRQTFVDADIHVSGHIHERTKSEWMREGITSQCVYKKTVQRHICLGTYKDDYADGACSWEANRGQPPKPQGGWWLRFHTIIPSAREDSHEGRVKYVDFDSIEADRGHLGPN